MYAAPKDMYKNLYSTVIHNSQKVKQSNCPPKMYWLIVVSSFNKTGSEMNKPLNCARTWINLTYTVFVKEAEYKIHSLISLSQSSKKYKGAIAIKVSKIITSGWARGGV